MVLQADVAASRMILVRDVELVRRAVGPNIRLRELVEVHVRHVLAIEHDVDQVLVARDLDVIPLADRRMAFRDGFTRS